MMKLLCYSHFKFLKDFSLYVAKLISKWRRTPVYYLPVLFLKNWVCCVAVKHENKYICYGTRKHFVNSEWTETTKTWKEMELSWLEHLKHSTFFLSAFLEASTGQFSGPRSFRQRKKELCFFCFKVLNRFHLTPFLVFLCQQYYRPSS
jgi:hypothetical protein